MNIDNLLNAIDHRIFVLAGTSGNDEAKLAIESVSRSKLKAAFLDALERERAKGEGEQLEAVLREPEKYPTLIRACAIAGHRACSTSEPTENGTWVPAVLKAALSWFRPNEPAQPPPPPDAGLPPEEIEARASADHERRAELEDRVARVIVFAYLSEEWDNLNPGRQEMWRGVARAAIASLRTATGQPETGRGEIPEREMLLIQSRIANGNTVWTDADRLLKALRAAEARAEALKKAESAAWDTAEAQRRRGDKFFDELKQAEAARDEAEGRAEKLATKYDELILAVGNVHPGETRHQTALRYIRQAEAPKPGDVGSTNTAAARGSP